MSYGPGVQAGNVGGNRCCVAVSRATCQAVFVGIDRPGSGDQPHEVDRPRETRELWASHGRELLRPKTPEQIEAEQKASRGELRWDGSGWVESEPFDHVKRRDRADRMREEVDLGERVRELPSTRDVLPKNLNWAEIDRRKFEDYSMNPDHPNNRHKADAWREVGYDVDTPEGRREAAREVKDLVYHELLRDGKVDTAKTRETPFGTEHRVLNGFIGPNDKHATLVTCWMVEDPGERGYPRLTTSWLRVHRDRENDQ